MVPSATPCRVNSAPQAYSSFTEPVACSGKTPRCSTAAKSSSGVRKPTRQAIVPSDWGLDPSARRPPGEGGWRGEHLVGRRRSRRLRHRRPRHLVDRVRRPRDARSTSTRAGRWTRGPTSGPCPSRHRGCAPARGPRPALPWARWWTITGPVRTIRLRRRARIPGLPLRYGRIRYTHMLPLGPTRPRTDWSPPRG